MRVVVSLYAPSSTTVTLSTYAEGLYRKWQETDSNEDFERLAEWILDDVAENLQIEIEDVEETS